MIVFISLRNLGSVLKVEWGGVIVEKCGQIVASLGEGASYNQIRLAAFEGFGTSLERDCMHYARDQWVEVRRRQTSPNYKG